MSFEPTRVAWYVWLLCALVAWGLRGFFEGTGSKRDGESISGPLAFVFGAAAVIAGALAVASFFRMVWTTPQ